MGEDDPRSTNLYTALMSLLVTGTVGIDTVQTPTQEVTGVLGGSCSYFAAAASFFCPVRIVAAVGGDWPSEHRSMIEQFDNICLEGLEHRSQSSTFAWGGKYLDNMNERETLFTDLNVLEEDPPPVPESYRDSRYIFLANTHPTEQKAFLENFPNRAISVVDTMNLWINIAHDELIELLRLVDGIVLNDSEAEMLTGSRNAVTAAEKILDFGPKFVVVKKGEHGCLLRHHNDLAVLPAYPAEQTQVIDPTGAGDSFAGGMMGYLAAQDRVDFTSLQTALAWGTIIASFTIESFSLDRLSNLTRGNIDERMVNFQTACRVGA